MGLLRTMGFIVSHPLNRGRPASAIRRYLRWQLGSRLVPGPVATPFVDDLRLLVAPGMTGATQNIYCGLHEFEEMAFVLHVLRSEDLFVDVGANVGSYSVLAAGAAGARCVSFEAHPDTFAHLQDNVRLNGLAERVTAHNLGIGGERGALRFTSGLDTVNHILAPGEPTSGSIEVAVRTLDEMLGQLDRPAIAKIDVEGFETEVLRGARSFLDSPFAAALVIELNGSSSRYGFDESGLRRDMSSRGFVELRYDPRMRVLKSANGTRSRGGNVVFGRDLGWLQQRVRSAPRFSVLSESI